MRDHGKSAERFYPAAAVVGFMSFARIEDARRKLWIFRDEYVCDGPPGAPGLEVAEDVDAVYDGDLGNCDWAAADLESTAGGAVAGRAQEISECFHRIQEIRRKAGTEVSQSLLKLFSILARKPVVASSPAIPSSLKCLKAQHDACRKEIDCF